MNGCGCVPVSLHLWKHVVGWFGPQVIVCQALISLTKTASFLGLGATSFSKSYQNIFGPPTMNVRMSYPALSMKITVTIWPTCNCREVPSNVQEHENWPCHHFIKWGLWQTFVFSKNDCNNIYSLTCFSRTLPLPSGRSFTFECSDSLWWPLKKDLQSEVLCGHTALIWALSSTEDTRTEIPGPWGRTPGHTERTHVSIPSNGPGKVPANINHQEY